VAIGKKSAKEDGLRLILHRPMLKNGSGFGQRFHHEPGRLSPAPRHSPAAKRWVIEAAGGFSHFFRAGVLPALDRPLIVRLSH
jgi:hypothetical protein